MHTAVDISGIGIHTGEVGAVRITSVSAQSGMVFVSHGVEIPADPAFIDDDTYLSTALVRGRHRVRTVEHLLAALLAVGEVNVRIEVTGPEIPILDGSAAPWMRALRHAGATGAFPLAPIVEPIEITANDSCARVIPLRPGEAPSISVAVDLSAVHLPSSESIFFPNRDAFDTIASARTFALAPMIPDIKRAGYAKGGSLENALVIDVAGALNPNGLRYPDEPARHKILDVIGDLALLGALPEATVTLTRPGHRLHHDIARAIQANRGSH